MDYIKIRFVDNADFAESEFYRTVEEMLRVSNPRFTLSRCRWRPQVDIYETRDEIVIQAEIAGVRQEEILLEISARGCENIRYAGRRRAGGRGPIPSGRNPLRRFRTHPAAPGPHRYGNGGRGLPEWSTGDPSCQAPPQPDSQNQRPARLIPVADIHGGSHVTKTI